MLPVPGKMFSIRRRTRLFAERGGLGDHFPNGERIILNKTRREKVGSDAVKRHRGRPVGGRRR